MNNFGNRKFYREFSTKSVSWKRHCISDERLLFLGGGQQSAAFIRCQPGNCCGSVCMCMHVCVKTSGFYQHSMSPV